MKRILIIGAGFLQNFVIKKAKEMGYYTITVDRNPNSIGFKYADDYNIVDIVNQEACLEYARTLDIDGVMTAATDYGVLTAAYISNQLGLPGLSYEVAKVIKNKYLVRRTLSENNTDDVSQYYEIGDRKELNEIINTIHYPVMVKPCDGSGSKAARRVDSINDLEIACIEAMDASLIGKALIEDFIEGTEYGVESFIYNGEVHVLGIMGKYMTAPPEYAELGHYIPCQLLNEDKVKEVVKKAVKALGINFGAVNMDVLITNEHRVCIVDVGARMGGNLIGSHLIPLGTGIDYIGNLIRSAMGDPVDLTARDTGGSIATRLLALKPGEVTGLPDFSIIKDKYKVQIEHFLRVGSLIREYRNNIDGCGYVISVSDDIREADMRAEAAKQLIDKSIKRKSP